jgi:hypothetical protein
MRKIYLITLVPLLLAGVYLLGHSDHCILWGMGLNPAKLTESRVRGKDGYMMVYSNATDLVIITHSGVSGVSVTRLMHRAHLISN